MLAAWTAAVVIFRTGPDRVVNRRLALLLVVEGLWLGGALGVLFFLEGAAGVQAVSRAGTSAMVAVPFLYLAFLGAALPTPLVAPMRARWMFWLLLALAAGCAAAVLVRPAAFLSEPYAPGWAPWNFRLVSLGQTFSQFQGVVYLYAFVAAVAVYTRTQCCAPVRRQAFWFALAFGARDAYLGVTLLLYPSIRPVSFWGEFLYNPVEGLVYLVYVVLLSYGVLQAQLFDIHVRLRIAVRRSTLVALIAAGFFLAAELLEQVVPVDGVLLGILAAGVIVLCLRPLQRVVERLVDHLVPVSVPSRVELEAKKLDVYRAALEGALHDSVVTEKEEQILLRLRRELQITDREAARLHREILSRVT